MRYLPCCSQIPKDYLSSTSGSPHSMLQVFHLACNRSVDDWALFRNHTINLCPSVFASQAVGMANTRATHRQWEASNRLPWFEYQYWPRKFPSSWIRNGGTNLHRTSAYFLTSLDMGDAFYCDQLLISLQREPNSWTINNGGSQLHDQPFPEHKYYPYRDRCDYSRSIQRRDYEWNTFVRLTYWLFSVTANLNWHFVFTESWPMLTVVCPLVRTEILSFCYSTL